MIVVGTTATIRPDIYVRTMQSWERHIKPSYPQWRHIINVDCLDAKAICPQADAALIIHEAHKFFDDVIWRSSVRPNFSMAFIWIWHQFVESGAPWLLWLEDDWEFLEDISAEEITATLRQHTDLALLRLPRWDSKDTCRQWDKHLPWTDGTFYEIPEPLRGTIGFSGNPSIIRREFAAEFMPYLVPTWCPEKQLKGGNRHFGIGTRMRKWRYGIWQRPHSKRVVRDIGRHWRSTSGWKKAGVTMFNRWERVDGQEEKT